MIPNSIFEQAKDLGLYLYREGYIFGYTPAFRNAENTIHRFYILGKGLVTASELLQDLQDNWSPVTNEELVYKEFRMADDFKELIKLQQAENL